MQRSCSFRCQNAQNIENMIPLHKGILLVFLAAFFSCSKSNDDCALVPAKILRYDCDRVIMQLETNEMIGDANWTDVQTGQSYNNVVSYYNTCEISRLTNGEKQTLYVRVQKTNENLIPDNCVQCQAIPQNPPQTKVVLTQIQTKPCDVTVE